MVDLGDTIIGTIIGGLVVYFVGRFLDRGFRNWASVKKEQESRDGDKTVENIAIRTDGPLSLEGRPVYIHNTGTIHNIEVKGDQKDVVEVIRADGSNAVIVPKRPTGRVINLQATVSGTTTVSGSLDVVSHKKK
jgi:hypothetical protein